MAEHPLDDALLRMLRDARPAAEAAPAADAGQEAEALLARIISHERPETATGTAVPGTPARGAPVRAGGRERRLFRPSSRVLFRLTVAGALAAVAVLAAGLAGAGPLGPVSGRPGTAAPSARSLPAIENAAYVTARMNASASGITTDVVQVQTTSGDGYTQDDWYGPRNNPVRLRTYGPGGRLLYDITETTHLITVVDYAGHDWWTYPNTPSALPAATACGVPGCVIVKPGTRGRNGIPFPPTLIKSLIQQGTYRVRQTGFVHGQRAVELTASRPGGLVVQLWVSAATFLPLRLSSTDGYPGSDLRSDTYYLAPTPANLAGFRLTMPAGFTHRLGPP
jgi:hypothetical protein